VREIKDLVDKEDFIPEKVFNSDDTGLFWKKMPNRTHVTKEEKPFIRTQASEREVNPRFCAVMLVGISR
jgi:hypothetical protein